MRIAIIGTRGLPAKYGGFETFAEKISFMLMKCGYDVTVQCDRNECPVPTFNGVNLYYSDYKKSQNPLKYYFAGLKWAKKNADVIFVTGSGGAVFYLLFSGGKKKIITNTDGIESKRTKWSVFHRLFLSFSELMAVKKSDFVVADSVSIKNYLLESYKVAENKIRVIEYGAEMNNTSEPEILKRYNIIHDGYYLVVCRIEPENNVSMIIDGYLVSGSEYPLVIVGNMANGRYASELLNKYKTEKIRFIGGVYENRVLNSIRYSCKAYIHGHSVGGTNPSLLEAMANKNLILAHNNVFNCEVTDNGQLYFSNYLECASLIMKIEKMSNTEIESYKVKSVERIIHYYSWDRILKKYLELLNSLE